MIEVGWISWLRWCFYGCINTVIAVFGIAANTALLYIIAHFPDMRKQSINIYLTVLALYDNGVLIFSILMLNIPAIADYHSNSVQPLSQANMSSMRYPTTLLSTLPSFRLEVGVNPTPTLLPYHQRTESMRKRANEPPSSCYSSYLVEALEVNCMLNQSQMAVKVVNSSDAQHLSQLIIVETLLQQALLRLHLKRIESSSVSASASASASATEASNSETSGMFILRQSEECRDTLFKSIHAIDTDGKQCRGYLAQMAHLLTTTYHALLVYLDTLPARTDPKLDAAPTDGSKPALMAMQAEEAVERTELELEPESVSECEPEVTASASVSSTSSDNSNPLPYYVKVVYPLALFSQTGSIWTTCLITIERYLAVCHPLMSLTLSTRSRAISALSLLSLLALVFNLPRFMEVDTSGDSIRPTELRRNTIYYYVYYICLNLTLNYIIPLSLLSALNIKIYASVRHANAHRNELTRARQSELHLASMLMLIVAIFIGCNAPAFIINCLELHFGVGDPVVEVATIFSNVLVCFNSAINFVIYCIFGKRFRAKLYQALGCGGHGHEADHHQQGTHRYRYVTTSGPACGTCRDLVAGGLNALNPVGEEGRFLSRSPSSSGTNHHLNLNHAHHHNGQYVNGNSSTGGDATSPASRCHARDARGSRDARGDTTHQVNGTACTLHTNYNHHKVKGNTYV